MTEKKIFKYFIILYPILDIIYSIGKQKFGINIPISQIIRVLFMIYMFIRLTDKKKKLIIILFFLFMIIEEITYMYMGNFYTLYNIQYILKILYFLTIVYSFEYIIENNILKKDEIIKYVIISSCIISISIIMSVFGIGFKTYVQARSGYKGFFLVQNAVTATLLIITPLNIYMYRKSNNKSYIISYVMSLMSLVIIGTKAGSVGALVIFVLQYLNLINKNKTNYLQKGIFCILSMALLVGLYTSKEYIYNYIIMHIEIMSQWGDPFSYIVSNRNLHIQWIDDYINSVYKDFNPLLLFGLGFRGANLVLMQNQYDVIEMDFYGILYYSGVWLLILILVVVLKRYFYCIRVLLINKFEYKYFAIFLSVSLGLIHSIFGGHVIYEALSSLYFGIVLTIGKDMYNRIGETT